MSIEEKQFNYINKLKEKLTVYRSNIFYIIICLGFLLSIVYLYVSSQPEATLDLANHIEDGNFKLIYQIDPSSTYEHPFDTEDHLSRFFEEHLRNTEGVYDVSKDDIRVTQEPVRLEVLPDGNEIYETHFKIDQTFSYLDLVEPFTLNPTDWCDAVTLNRTIDSHNLRGSVIQCSQEFDQARNVGEEYIHPTDPEIMSGYHPIIDYMKANPSDLPLDPEDFDGTIELVNTAIADGVIPDNGCGDYHSGMAQINHGPEGGSTYTLTGCNRDCREFNPAELPRFTTHGVDTSYTGSISYDSPGINIGCVDGYSSAGDITLTCNTASADGYYSVDFGSTTPDQACEQNCIPMEDNLDKYVIGSNTLNIASSPPIPLSFNSRPEDYTILCGQNYSQYPRDVPPQIELCTEGGGNYRLSGCSKDSLKPENRKLLQGYKIRGTSAANVSISRTDIETSSAEELGLSCNISETEKYHGRPKILGAHEDIGGSDRNYYYPYGCYNHANCSTDGKTCIQTSFFFKFDDPSKYNPTMGGQENIVIQGSAEARQDIMDLEDIIRETYTLQGNQDIDEFTVEIVQTKWIDDTFGHDIIYTVTCEAGRPCNLTTNEIVTFSSGDTLLLHEEEFNEIVDSGNRTINPNEVTEIELYKLPENLPSSSACAFGELVQSEIGLSLKGIFEINCGQIYATPPLPEQVGIYVPPPITLDQDAVDLSGNTVFEITTGGDASGGSASQPRPPPSGGG